MSECLIFHFWNDARKLPRSLLKKIAESSVSDEWACLAVHFFLIAWETCLLVWWRLKTFRSELLFANHVSQYWKIYCQHLRQDCQAPTVLNMETWTSPPSCCVGIHGFDEFQWFERLGLTSWPFGNAFAAGYGENNFQHHHSADPSRIHRDMICEPSNDPNDHFRKGQDSFTFRLLPPSISMYSMACDNSWLGKTLRKNKHRWKAHYVPALSMTHREIFDPCQHQLVLHWGEGGSSRQYLWRTPYGQRVGEPRELATGLWPPARSVRSVKKQRQNQAKQHQKPVQSLFQAFFSTENRDGPYPSPHAYWSLWIC